MSVCQDKYCSCAETSARVSPMRVTLAAPPTPGVKHDYAKSRLVGSMPDLVDWVFDTLNCQEALTKKYIEIALGDIVLFDRKQHDYGPENIAAFGEKGVVVRMNDKMARLRKLIWSDLAAKNESVEDSYTDMGVYSIIARLCRSGAWSDTELPPERDDRDKSTRSAALGPRVEVVQTYERGPRVGARGTVMPGGEFSGNAGYRVKFDAPFPAGSSVDGEPVGWFFNTLRGETDGISIRPVMS